MKRRASGLRFRNAAPPASQILQQVWEDENTADLGLNNAPLTWDPGQTEAGELEGCAYDLKTLCRSLQLRADPTCGTASSLILALGANAQGDVDPRGGLYALAIDPV